MKTFRHSTAALPMLIAVAMLLGGTLVFVQGNVPAAGAAPQAGGQGRGGGGGGLFPAIENAAYSDYAGYTSLWDGRTFNGWDGESDVWSIENGMIHADTTKTPGQHHLHYVGPNAVMRDFDLKVEFKISADGANGGIQYRSRLLMAPHKGSMQNPLGAPMPRGITTFLAAVQAGIAEPAPARGNPPPANAQGGNAQGRQGGNAPAPAPSPTAGFQNPWQVSGYQFDLDSNNRFTGQLYEGQGRGVINPPGGLVQFLPDRKFLKLGTVSANPAAAVKPHRGLDGEWQQVQIIARGNTLIHILNGQVITVSIDDDPASRASQGILSLQLEGSGQIWYRNVYVRQFDRPAQTSN